MNDERKAEVEGYAEEFVAFVKKVRELLPGAENDMVSKAWLELNSNRRTDMMRKPNVPIGKMLVDVPKPEGQTEAEKRGANLETEEKPNQTPPEGAPEPASKAQKGKIWGIGERGGATAKNLIEKMLKAYNKTKPDDLTKAEAMKIIDECVARGWQ